MFIDDLQHGGYKPFRDHTKNVLVNHRNVVYGLGIKDTNEEESEWKSEKYGDLQFAHFFGGAHGKRECGSWSLATPALWGDDTAIPIRDKTLKADEKYKYEEVTSITGRAHAKGTPGIVLGASIENEEHKLFFPAAGADLIAHHRGPQPPDFSSLVYDIDGAGGIDPNRKAGLHSAWWVQKLTPTIGALAMNFTKSRGDDTGWGLYYSQPGGGGSVDRNAPLGIMAFGSWERRGPWHPGHRADKHQEIQTPDGPVNAGHIWTNALFYMDQFRDGSLDFETALHPKTVDVGIPSQVHLRWDTNTDRWRWHVKIPIFEIPPPDGPPTPPGKPPRRPPTTPRTPPGKPPIEGTGDPKIPPGGLRLPQPLPPFPEPRKKPKKPLPLVGTLKKMMLPGIAFQATPAKTVDKWAKFGGGREDNDDLAGHLLKKSSRDISKSWSDQIDKALKKGVIPIQMEPYGKEVTPGKLSKNKAQPNRYRSDTGPGGLLIMPPELGMDDYEDSFSPGHIQDVSSSYVTFLSQGRALGKTFLAFGSPDLDTGGIKSGFRMAMEDTDFYFRGIDSAGAADLTKVLNMNAKVVQNGIWQYPSGASSGYVLTSDATGTASWAAAASAGDVVGPASSVDNAIARFDSTTGKLLQNSEVTILDTGSILTTGSTPPDITIRKDTSDGNSGFLIFEGLESSFAQTPRRWKIREEISAGTRDHSLAFIAENSTSGADVKMMEGLFTGGSAYLVMNERIDMARNIVDHCAGIYGNSGNLDLSGVAGGEVTINESGSDVNFRIEGDTDANLLVCDAGLDFVGIGKTAPGSKLDLKGTLRLSGSTSGYVGLAPAAAAGATTYTLPAADGAAGEFLKTSGAGVLSWAAAAAGGATSGARAWRAGNQTLSDITSTKIQLNQENYDLGGEFDPAINNRFTAATAGYYWIYGQIYWGGGNSNVITSMIFLNGAEVAHTDLQQLSQYNVTSVGTVWHLNIGDYVELWGYHNSGASRTVYGGASSFTFLCVQKVG